jgi:4-amino-4-deoxy-L-arabinose transferase-like glycosyltransferase
MSRTRARRKTDARPRSFPWPLTLFLTAIFLVKLIVLLQLQHHPLLEPGAAGDSGAYVRLATEVRDGNVLLGPGLYYVSPLYIYFLAAGLWMSGSFVFVRVVQLLLGAAAEGFIFGTARAWFGERAAWVAVVLAALTGIFTFYEILILQSSIDVFLTSAALYALTRAMRAPRAGVAAQLAAGVLFGLQTLNRPNVLAGAAGVILVLLVIRRWRVAVWLTAGLVLALAPVVVRNAVVSHQFALVSSQGGLNFYIGNNETATGRYQEVPGVRPNADGQAEDTRRVAEAGAGTPLSDAGVSAYFRDRALAWMKAHPTRAAALFGRKLALVFNASHAWLDFSYPYYAYDTGSILRYLVVGPWLLVPLGIAGLFVVGPARRREFAAWAAFVPGAAIGVAVFFVAERYRLPLFVPLCVTSGAAVVGFLDAAPKRRAWIAAVCLAGAVLAWWPFHLNDGRYDERLMLARVLMDRHDYGRAAIELERAHALQPGNTVVQFDLGLALVSSGRGDEGIAQLRQAVDAGVLIPGARYVLVSAMLGTGDRQGAARLVRTFHPLPSDTADSCYRVALMALDAGAPDAAVEFLRRAVALRPGWREPQDLLQQITGGR